MTYTAKEIARYFVDWFYKNEKAITNMQLQKLLFFGWIEYYKQTGQELFHEAFEAWRYGPVVPEEYHRYGQFGGGPIFFWFPNPDEIPKIDSKTKKILDLFLASRQDARPFDLVYESHTPNGAWNQTQKTKGLYQPIDFDLIKELKQ